MAALLRRAKDLNAISEWQYRSTVIEMSALGYRTSEPGSVPAERPERIDALVDGARLRALSLEDLAACTHLLPEDFTTRYAPRSAITSCTATTPASKARP